jgi:protein SCO1/2
LIFDRGVEWGFIGGMHEVAEIKAQRGTARRLMLAGLVLAGVVLAGLIGMNWMRGSGDGFSYYGQWIGSTAADFSLTDQDGKPETLSGMKGDVVLLTFGFTHCPNVCPTTLANLAKIYEGLPAEAQGRVKVLFITVDPHRDTPKVMKDYVGFYAKGFTGLTGSDDEIAKVAKSYGAFYEAVMQQSSNTSDYYTMNHSAYVYLVDPAGRYALLYDNDKLADHGKMIGDIEHVLEGR